MRAVSLAQLELTENAVVYDVGAGTGSVSVEAARSGDRIRVYAIEKKDEAVRLLEQNRKKFRTDGIRIVEGEAPEALRELEPPTHVFIGGSSGNLREILRVILEKNPSVRIVVNAISLETVGEAMAAIEEGLLKNAQVTQIMASRSRVLGRYHMMTGQNPVYIISAGGEMRDDAEERPEERECGPMKIPGILIAAPASGSGKTAVSCALMAALQARGLKVRACKCGPDYIDPMFHREVLGVDSRNLDLFFSEPDELRQGFIRHASGADIVVTEGVMGYYDGRGMDTDAGSSYDVACTLNLPVILVINCRGAALSLAALVRGMAEFRADSNICGILLNRTSKMLYPRLKAMLEQELGKYGYKIPVLGYVPEDDAFRLESRHLDLLRRRN